VPQKNKKKQSTKWKITFASHSSNRGLISITHKELKKLNIKKQSNQLMGI
jgi:hypothetical protein